MGITFGSLFFFCLPAFSYFMGNISGKFSSTKSRTLLGSRYRMILVDTGYSLFTRVCAQAVVEYQI